MFVTINAPTGLTERPVIVSGGIKRDGFPSLGVIYTASDNPSPDDFDTEFLLKTKAINPDAPEDAAFREFHIIGGYYMERDGEGATATITTTKVFGVALDPAQGFSMTENGNTTIGDDWDHLDPRFNTFNLDEKASGSSAAGWTLIVLEAFDNRDLYPPSGRPLDLIAPCASVVDISVETQEETDTTITMAFTAIREPETEPPTGYQWDFGDGNSAESDDETVVHTYQKGSSAQVVDVTVAAGVQLRCPESVVTIPGIEIPPLTACPELISIEKVVLMENAIGAEVQFTVQVDGIEASRYEWDFGDGSPPVEGKTVLHTFIKEDEPKVYQVSVTSVGPDNCPEKTITIDCPIDDSSCPELSGIEKEIIREDALELAMSFTAVFVDEEATKCTWNFGDGSPEVEGKTVTHVFVKLEEAVTFTVSVTAEVPDECSSQTTSIDCPVSGRECPEFASITKTVVRSDALEVEVEFAVLTVGVEPSRCVWNFGDGSPEVEGKSVVHVFERKEDTETYLVTVTADVPEGCPEQTLTVECEIGEITCPELDRIDKEVLSESALEVEVQFTAQVKDEEASVYTWNFGDGSPEVDGKTVVHRFVKVEEPATYLVTLTAGVPAECAAQSLTIECPVDDFSCPELEQIVREVIRDNAVELEVQFTAEVKDEEALSYTWDFGDGSPEEQGKTVTHVYEKKDELQVFTVTVTAEVPSECEAQTLSIECPVPVHGCPTLESITKSIILSNAVECEVEFALVFEGAEPLRCVWDMGDGSPPKEGKSVRHTYPRKEETVTYVVTVVAEVPEECEPQTLTIECTVEELTCPELEAIQKTTLRETAVELEVEFTALVKDEEASRYEWDFGDGSSPVEGKTVTHVYAKLENPATYTVTLTADVPEECEVQRLTVECPVDEFSCPELDRIEKVVLRETAVELEIQCTAHVVDEEASEYTWNFGDGSDPKTGKTVTHVYVKKEDSETYAISVVAEVPDECTEQQLETTCDVGEITCAELDGIEKVILREDAVELEIQFTANVKDEEASKYTWDFGDATATVEGKTVTHTYVKGETAETYTVTVVAEVPEECPPQTLTIDCPVGENACPELDAIEKVIVREDAVELEVQFTANVKDEEASKYTWDFGDMAPSVEGKTVNHVYLKGEEATTYVVTLTADVPPECPAQEITIDCPVGENECPVLDRIDKVIIRDDALELEIECTAVVQDEEASKYTWDFGDATAPAEGKTVRHVYTKGEEPQTYTITVTADVPPECPGQEMTIECPVGEHACPELDVIEKVIVEDNAVALVVEFTANVKDEEASKYTWDFGDTSATAEGKTVTHTYVKGETAETYTVTVVAEVPEECPPQTLTIDCPVGENACPELDAIEKVIVREDAVELEVQFTANVKDEEASKYTWDFGDMTPSVEGKTVNHVYLKGEEATTYVVTLTADVPPECPAQEITIDCPVGENECPVLDRIDKVIIRDDALELEIECTAVVQDEEASKYTWDFGDATAPAEGKTVRHVYTKGEEPQTYTITVTADVPPECPGQEMTIECPVGEHACPELDVIEKVIVEDNAVALVVEFTANVKDEEASKYTWDFGDTSATAEGKTVTHTYVKGETAETYTVTVVAEVPEECPPQTLTIDCPVSENTCFEIEQVIHQVIEVRETEVEVQFTIQGSGDAPTECEWDFGDESPLKKDSGTSITHIYTRPEGDAETYTVSVTCSGPVTCSTSGTTSVVIEGICPEVLSVQITGEQVLPDEQVVSFAVQVKGPAPDRYVWDFGDATPLVPTLDPTVQHTYQRPVGNPGLYTATVTVEGPDSCSTQQSIDVFIHEKCPGIDRIRYEEVSKTDEYYTVKVIVETVGPAADRYEWTWNDGSPDDTTLVPEIEHQFKRPIGESEAYMVQVALKGPGICDCMASTRIAIPGICPYVTDFETTIQDPAQAVQKVQATVVVAGPTPEEYQWDWGDGTTTKTVIPTAEHDYQRPIGADKEYTITVDIKGPETCECTSSAKVEITALCPEILGHDVEILSVEEKTQQVKITLEINEPFPEKYLWYFDPTEEPEETTEPVIEHLFDRPPGGDKEKIIQVRAVGPGECGDVFDVPVVLKGYCPDVLELRIEVFEATESTQKVGVEVLFVDLPAEGYSWDWGDGTQSTTVLPRAEHDYTRVLGKNKEYTITLVANGPDYCTDRESRVITITGICPKYSW